MTEVNNNVQLVNILDSLKGKKAEKAKKEDDSKSIFDKASDKDSNEQVGDTVSFNTTVNGDHNNVNVTNNYNAASADKKEDKKDDKVEDKKDDKTEDKKDDKVEDKKEDTKSQSNVSFNTTVNGDHNNVNVTNNYNEAPAASEAEEGKGADGAEEAQAAEEGKGADAAEEAPASEETEEAETTDKADSQAQSNVSFNTTVNGDHNNVNVENNYNPASVDKTEATEETEATDKADDTEAADEVETTDDTEETEDTSDTNIQNPLELLAKLFSFLAQLFGIQQSSGATEEIQGKAVAFEA